MYDKKLGLEKPLTCESYPLQLLKLRDYIIVLYIPCPNFILGKGNNSIKYIDSTNVILRYLETEAPIRELPADISNERIEQEIDFQENFKKNVLEEAVMKYEKEGFEKWLIYYLGIRWNKKIIEMPMKKTLNFWEVYLKVCENLYMSFNFSAESNIIYLITQQFLSEIEDKNILRIVK